MYHVEACQFCSVGSCVYSNGLSLPLKLFMYINVEEDGFWEQLQFGSSYPRPPFFAVFTSSVFAALPQKKGGKRGYLRSLFGWFGWARLVCHGLGRYSRHNVRPIATCCGCLRSGHRRRRGQHPGDGGLLLAGDKA
jgi:hypothetical protein